MKIIVNDLHAYEMINNGHVMISYTKRYNCYDYLHSHHVSFTTAIIWYDRKIYNIESWYSTQQGTLCLILYDTIQFSTILFHVVLYDIYCEL